jgi:hypothetical protein
MKHQSIGKKLLKKTGLFSILLLLLSGIPNLSFSQNINYPLPPAQKLQDAPIEHKIEPVEQNKHYIPSQMFPPDIVSPQDKIKDEQQPASQKLTSEQIKKIVGNDKVLGKDAQGHQLYQNSKGETYYLLDNGAQVILK